MGSTRSFMEPTGRFMGVAKCFMGRVTIPIKIGLASVYTYQYPLIFVHTSD